jgi:hypothetical protein
VDNDEDVDDEVEPSGPFVQEPTQSAPAGQPAPQEVIGEIRIHGNA